jgi:hypothetical protein
MPVILYLGTGSAYIKLKGLFMLWTNKIQRIFQYLPQFKIYFSRTFRPCIITFRFVFNYTSIPLYSQICIEPECEGTNLISGSQIGGSFKPWLKVGGKLSKKNWPSKKGHMALIFCQKCGSNNLVLPSPSNFKLRVKASSSYVPDKGHSREHENVSFMSSCPLYTS